MELFWSAFFRIFRHLDWIRRDTPYLSVISPNAGKWGKNAHQNNSEYGPFLGSDTLTYQYFDECNTSYIVSYVMIGFDKYHLFCDTVITSRKSTKQILLKLCDAILFSQIWWNFDKGKRLWTSSGLNIFLYIFLYQTQVPGRWYLIDKDFVGNNFRRH